MPASWRDCGRLLGAPSAGQKACDPCGDWMLVRGLRHLCLGGQSSILCAGEGLALGALGTASSAIKMGAYHLPSHTSQTNGAQAAEAWVASRLFFV